MKASVVVILGLFESVNDQLFQALRQCVQRQGYECYGIELYQGVQFGSYSFAEEIERVMKIVQCHNPMLIIAHSLGAYVALQFQSRYPLLLLDPSLAITNIIYPNLQAQGSAQIYNDGETLIVLSREFVASLAREPSIEEVSQNKGGGEIHIVGAGRGGHKIAERYHALIPHSRYTLLQGADHNFSDKQSTQEINMIIKKRLEIISSRG